MSRRNKLAVGRMAASLRAHGWGRAAWRANSRHRIVRTTRIRATFRASPTIPENSMHDASSNQNAGRYVPFKQEGWGIALFVVLLAAGAAGFATYVHKSTYRHPTDVRFQATGSSGSHE
jgi:hypothetical protein